MEKRVPVQYRHSFYPFLTYVLCASNLYPAGIPFREIKPAAPVPGAKIRTSRSG